jgi:hypothetical protein
VAGAQLRGKHDLRARESATSAADAPPISAPPLLRAGNFPSRAARPSGSSAASWRALAIRVTARRTNCKSSMACCARLMAVRWRSKYLKSSSSRHRGRIGSAAGTSLSTGWSSPTRRSIAGRFDQDVPLGHVRGGVAEVRRDRAPRPSINARHSVKARRRIRSGRNR